MSKRHYLEVAFGILVIALSACSGGSDSSGNSDTSDSSSGTQPITVSGISAQMSGNTSYVITNDSTQVALTLPATSSLTVGDTISITGQGAGGWKILQNNGQSINVSSINDSDLNGTAGATWVQRDTERRNWKSVAMSSNGSQLVAAVFNGNLYTSSDFGASWTAHMTDTTRQWWCVASSSDGKHLIATEFEGHLYTSDDYGNTWTARMTDAKRNWFGVASSSDGSRLVATVEGEYIYTSSDYGVSWQAQATDTARNWKFVASSSDGTKLVAATYESLYTSQDAGATWTSRLSSDSHFYSVSSSANGSKLIASGGGSAVNTGHLFTSTDSGLTWTERATDAYRDWTGVASSSDGKYLIAAQYLGSPYISRDSGETWSALTSKAQIWGVASSSDAHKLALAGYIGFFYTSVLETTTNGETGSIAGTVGGNIVLTYQGDGVFVVSSHKGEMTTI